MKFISANKGLRVLFYSLVLATLPISALARAHASPISGAYFQQTISGTVSDGSGPLPGALIVVKGTTRSVATDPDGNYYIAASAGDVLVFSFTGFKTVEVIVGSQSTVDITLEEDALQLEEVTINAGYYNVKQKEATGSIARITAKEIETQPVTNMLAAMQGRMAGVEIIQDSGVPGGSFQIKIRGQNSLRADGNSPLYIIDGVPYSSEPIGYSQTSTTLPSVTSPLNSINPSDIQSIEILKDADATAIYGSRGANGVVLITTKKGKPGKASIAVNSWAGTAKVANFVDLMKTSEYLAMRRQAFANDGVTDFPVTAYDVNGTWDQGRYTDWQKELIGRTAQINSTQLSLSGGSETTQYLLSGTHYRESTVFPGNFGYRKGVLHFNINHTPQDSRLSVSLSGGYTAQDNKLPATDLTRISRTLAPNAPALYDENGELNWENSTFTNPLSELRSEVKSNTYDLVLNGVIGYRLANGLDVKASLGLTDLKTHETRALPSTMYDPAYGIGSSESSLLSNHTFRQSWIMEPQLHYSATLWGGKLDALLGTTFQQQRNTVLYQMGYGYSSNSLIYDLAAAGQVFVIASEEKQYRYQAAFGRVNYNWDGRYIVNITGRRDGSSRFGPGKRFANFGAVGGAWIFSNEEFFENRPLSISFAKIRASYGITGNDQIGDYQFLSTYGSTGVPYQGIIGLAPARLYNADFSWEKNKKLEVALETGFFNDRIFFTAAWYRNLSSSQLVGIPLAGTTGFASINANLGATVENKGFEFTLRAENFRGKDFDWTTSFTIALARNKLLSFPGLENSSYANTYVIGQPTTIAKLYHYEGIDPQTGLYQFTDVNGDGVLTSDKDRQAVTDLTPEYFGGLQNQLRYKGWSLDFLFQFTRQQNYDYNAGVPAGQLYNQRTDAGNAWSAPGSSAQYQVLTAGGNSAAVRAYYNYTSSNAVIVDGSFIRLKNISLSYTLPPGLLRNLNCRLYLQGQNVFTLTAYKGGDPEFKNSGFLPPLRIFSGGAQISF